MTQRSETAPLLPQSTADIAAAAEGPLNTQAHVESDEALAVPDRIFSAPPPQHTHADHEAAYRFGASIAWKLGCLFGSTASLVSMIGYMNLSNTNLTSITIPFSVAIGTILIHALLLLAISLRLGAYRAANYHHTHATRCYSNPVSKIRIHSPAVFVVVGTVGFSGGLLVGLFMDDYSLGGFWPFIPAGAVSLSMGWLSLMWI